MTCAGDNRPPMEKLQQLLDDADANVEIAKILQTGTSSEVTTLISGEPYCVTMDDLAALFKYFETLEDTDLVRWSWRVVEDRFKADT